MEFGYFTLSDNHYVGNTRSANQFVMEIREQALLAEGGTLDDPAGFVRRMNELMLDMAGGKSRIWTPGT